jgi:hypothetical protein
MTIANAEAFPGTPPSQVPTPSGSSDPGSTLRRDAQPELFQAAQCSAINEQLAPTPMRHLDPFDRGKTDSPIPQETQHALQESVVVRIEATHRRRPSSRQSTTTP